MEPWLDEVHLELDGHRFVAGALLVLANREDEFVIMKPRELVNQYLRLLEREKSGRIVEIGTREGGSTALIALAANPELLLGVDIEDRAPPLLARFLEGREGVRVKFGLDQSDRAGLTRFLDREGGTNLDLVVDDASHVLAPTRVSFEVLFPRLRPGGVYIIEDWTVDWQIASAISRLHPDDFPARFANVNSIFSHLNRPETGLPTEINEKIAQAAGEVVGQGRTFLESVAEAVDRADIAPAFNGRATGANCRPLADLAVELSMIRASSPDIISELCIDGEWILVRRGTAALDEAWRLANAWTDHFGYLP